MARQIRMGLHGEHGGRGGLHSGYCSIKRVYAGGFGRDTTLFGKIGEQTYTLRMKSKILGLGVIIIFVTLVWYTLNDKRLVPAVTVGNSPTTTASATSTDQTQQTSDAPKDTFTENPDGSHTYTSNRYGFSFNVPTGWTFSGTELSSQSSIGFATPFKPTPIEYQGIVDRIVPGQDSMQINIYGGFGFIEDNYTFVEQSTSTRTVHGMRVDSRYRVYDMRYYTDKPNIHYDKTYQIKFPEGHVNPAYLIDPIYPTVTVLNLVIQGDPAKFSVADDMIASIKWLPIQKK